MAKVAQATRRRTRRQAVDWRTRCRFEASDRWRDCRFVDVSPAGAALEIDAPAPERGRIAVELPSEGRASCAPLPGRVRHLRPTDAGTVIVGIEFTRLTREQLDRLDELLSSAAPGGPTRE